MTTSPRTILTFTGKVVNPVALQPAEVCVEDIAHALAYHNRYTGHGRFFYSVGMHSCWVADLLASHGGDPMHGLLHDAAEAYLGDINWAVKAAIAEVWEPLEHNTLLSIYKGLGVVPPTPEDHALVKFWDDAVRGAEGVGLFGEAAWAAAGGPPPHPDTGRVAETTPTEAETLFLRFYHNIGKGEDLWAGW